MTGAEIEDEIKNHARYGITKIRVLRAEGQIPVNKQVGATCGIYALDAALRIQGHDIAPPRKRQEDPDWRSLSMPRNRSIRGKAKEMGLTKIGEIGGARDLAALAGGLGIQVEIKQFGSKDELWTLIRDAVDAGKGIVMPYACVGDDGAPAWSVGADGFAHWCLLFGYAEYSEGAPRVFMTTYGNYLEVSPFRLFKANQRIQDWPRQNWIKLTLWQRRPNMTDWEPFEDNWQADATLRNDLGERAKLFGAAGWGFGIGTPQQLLHSVIDPPNPTYNLNIASAVLQKATLKSADLQKVEYTKTLRGQCVVV